jgi:hypothetical protein
MQSGTSSKFDIQTQAKSVQANKNLPYAHYGAAAALLLGGLGLYLSLTSKEREASSVALGKSEAVAAQHFPDSTK